MKVHQLCEVTNLGWERVLTKLRCHCGGFDWSSYRNWQSLFLKHLFISRIRVHDVSHTVCSVFLDDCSFCPWCYILKKKKAYVARFYFDWQSCRRFSIIKYWSCREAVEGRDQFEASKDWKLESGAKFSSPQSLHEYSAILLVCCQASLVLILCVLLHVSSCCCCCVQCVSSLPSRVRWPCSWIWKLWDQFVSWRYV